LIGDARSLSGFGSIVAVTLFDCQNPAPGDSATY
jgi:hypothetical protein